MGVASIAILIPIVSIIGAFIMVIYLRRYQNQERMAMIEKGVSPETFVKKEMNVSATLRFSLMLIGVGTGILLGYFLDRAYDMEEPAYFSMVFLFGGLGLGAAYVIEERKTKREG